MILAFMGAGKLHVGIDASRKGNIARFINHSCDPNTATRKWAVNGEISIGLFALKDISKETEITFDYQFERIGGAKQKCLCGSTNCRGFLGAKPVEQDPIKRPPKYSLSSHQKHVQTILKNISWQNLDLAILETEHAVIRNRSQNEPPLFMQRNYRKQHLAHLHLLQQNFDDLYRINAKKTRNFFNKRK